MGFVINKLKKASTSKKAQLLKSKNAPGNAVPSISGFKILSKEQVEAGRSKAYKYVC